MTETTVPTVRWGVVGTGMIARVLAGQLPQARGAVRRAVASRDRAKAEAFARELGFAKAYGSYDELYADPEVDAVYITTPHTSHHADTLAALRAGKHVLVEKPMAVTVAQAEEMVAAARAAKRVLLEAFMYRIHPQTLRLEQVLRRGDIGEVRVVRSCFTFDMGNAANIRFDPALYGGALWDVGCYCVNASRMVGGGEPVGVSGQATIERATGVDIATAGALRFAGGAVAHFDVGIRSAGSAWLEILGSQGRIHVPNPWKPDAARTAFTVEAGGKRREEAVEAGRPLYALEAEHMAAAIAGADSPITGERGIGNTRVLEALWRQVLP